LGFNWPVISFRNVDLPAPFGPSRPVMPLGTETVTSLRPMTCPYHFDTWSAVTIGGDDASRAAGSAVDEGGGESDVNGFGGVEAGTVTSPPLSSGGLRPPKPPYTLARAASRHHLHTPHSPLQDGDRNHDQGDDDEQRDLPRRGVARLHPEHHV